jgi:hypothetical protein
MTTPRPRSASVTVTPSQINHDTSAETRWYSDAEPVTVHTLHALLLAVDARLARIETRLEENGQP